jgi:hyperosmotically inducible periplasmic protein
MKTTLLILICGLGLAGCNKGNDTAQTPSPTPSSTAVADASSSTPTTQPNNSGINTRDQAPGAITAGQQSQTKSDVDITADIRRRVMDGKMSVAAQNVKIVSQTGKVTLRGPVNSQDEKDSIGRMANDVAGADNVDNELEVKPNG